jgi:hypothetical protein
VKPGKIGWVQGTKLAFFEGHKDAYHATAEIKETGDFYSHVSQLYLDKYGYNTPWDGDLEEGQDVADDVDPNEDVDTLSREEGEARAQYYSKLRNVSLPRTQLVRLLTPHPRRLASGITGNTAMS